RAWERCAIPDGPHIRKGCLEIGVHRDAIIYSQSSVSCQFVIRSRADAHHDDVCGILCSSIRLDNYLSRNCQWICSMKCFCSFAASDLGSCSCVQGFEPL